MPHLFHQKLLCFYCGSRSVQARSPQLRKWKCEKCEAVNYLDENGEITDPPPLDTFSEARFAQSIPRAVSPVFASTEETLFCPTCIQNQKFMTEALASYFPSPTASDYSEYEEKYPEFRKNLEARYPQVCRTCEPRVRERIRASGYAAKTDHLRRMMERSRDGGRYHSIQSWKSFAAVVGAIGWGVSVMGQLLWDVQGAVVASSEDTLGGEEFSSISNCVWDSWSTLEVTSECAEGYDSAAGLALGLGVLFIWWNPKLYEKSRKASVRIVGLSEYYQLQAMLLIFRFASWSVFVRLPSYEFSPQMVKAVHASMIVFTIASTLISFSTVRVDSTPQVLFQESPAPLVEKGKPIASEFHPIRQLNINKDRSATLLQPFSINNFAPTPPRLHQPQYNPPTPPMDEDEDEAMDWTPSQQALPSASTYRQLPSTRIQPSPFYGHLPPAPKSQAHLLRNPSAQPTRKTPSAPVPNPFQRPRKQPDLDELSEIGSDTAETPCTKINRSGVPVQFASPRLLPRPDSQKDTGLESIFSTTFSIAEEPHELRIARQEQPAHISIPRPAYFRFLTVIVSILFTAAWLYAPYIPSWAKSFRLGSLTAAIAVAGRGLLDTISKNEQFWRWSEILVYTSELGFVTLLASAVKYPSIGADAGELRAIGFGLLAAMACQECWLLYRELGDERKQNLFAPTPSPCPPANPSAPNNSLVKTSSAVQPWTTSVSERVTRSRSKAGNSAGELRGLSLGR